MSVQRCVIQTVLPLAILLPFQNRKPKQELWGQGHTLHGEAAR